MRVCVCMCVFVCARVFLCATDEGLNRGETQCSVRRRTTSQQREIPHLEYPLQVAHDGHLLVQLRALGQARRPLKSRPLHVLELEHVGPSLGSACYHLGGLDLAEALLKESSPVVVTDGALDSEDGVLRGDAHVDDAVVQPDVVADADKGPVDLSGLLLPLRLDNLGFRAARIVDLEGETRLVGGWLRGGAV